MSNTCFVDTTITVATEREAKMLFDYLKGIFKEADEKKVGAYIGSKDRYLFDPFTGIKDNTVYMDGVVKWCVTDTDIKDILDWLISTTRIIKLSMRYECHEDLQYGEYVYNGKTLKDTWLKEEDFPEDTDDSPDYYERKEELFQEKKQTKIIPFH